ncbi:MAG TPA: pyridoxamine 5'-phosphate oxidase [Chitinophagaceae bacterium]|nr:pyridoxamine 5'-phosphate oxidase [Chitinophagaceae bacterium]
MQNGKTIADLRRDYRLQSLSENDVAANPIQQFSAWWSDVIASEIVEPNAMTLATASSDGLPSARIVLLKGFDERGFVFFTNYNSFKGLQLQENPRACLVFFWKELERQVRIIGVIEKIAAEDNDEYFNSRPEGSRIGAIISPQSQVIESREWLEKRVQEVSQQLSGQVIPRPDHWGGYRVRPAIIEFWQGRANRLHDRIQYTLSGDGSWKLERLAP